MKEQLEFAAKNIIAFRQIIEKLNGNNVRIGGTLALGIHGLHLGRQIDDLDLVIYNPTPEQLNVLEVLETLSQTIYYGKDKRTIKVIGKGDLREMTEEERIGFGIGKSDLI